MTRILPLLWLMVAISLHAQTVTVDNVSARFSATGEWTTAGPPGTHGSSARLAPCSAIGDAQATWTADLPTSGIYEVAVWYLESETRAPDAAYEIVHAEGTASVTRDQTTSGSQWIPLGAWFFEPQGASVTLINRSAREGASVCADAVRFRLEGTEYGNLYQGMWIYSWGVGFLTPDQTEAMIATARNSNQNIILPQVRKAGDAYYKSDIEPFADNVEEGYEDPLADILEKAHDTSDGKQYIQVDAWMVPYRVWNASMGTPPDGHVLKKHPEWEGRRYDGKTDSTITLDPGVPGVTDYLVDVATELVEKYDVDGIHWDYFRYQSWEWGYNPIALARFKRLYNRTEDPDPRYDEEFNQFRRDQICHMGRKVYAAVKAVRWKCRISAATIGWGDILNGFEATRTYNEVFQDWPRFMEEGLLDMNVHMAYKREYVWDQARDFRDWMRVVGDRKGGRHGVDGPGVYLNSIEDSVTQIQTALDLPGVDGTIVYVYHATNKDGVSPTVFWDTIRGDCFSRREVPVAPWLETPDHGILRGAVTGGGIVLDGAGVQVLDGSGEWTETDGTGFYAFLKLPGGRAYTISAAPHPRFEDGLTTRTAEIYIPAGEVVTLDFDLTLQPQAHGFFLH